MFYYRNRVWFYNAQINYVQVVLLNVAAQSLGAVTLSQCNLIDEFWITALSPATLTQATQFYVVAFNASGVCCVDCQQFSQLNELFHRSSWQQTTRPALETRRILR